MLCMTPCTVDSPRPLPLPNGLVEISGSKTLSESAESADMLSISPKTVETHRSELMQKLDTRDVPGLVRYAIRHGLISVDQDS